MNDWINDLRRLRDSGEDSAMVSVAGVRGSAPREVGAKMIVTARQTIGSIGGGQLEYRCAKIAFDLLQAELHAPAAMHRFPLGASMGQCCGGVVDVLVERTAAIDPQFIHELLRLHDDRVPFVIATSTTEKSLVSATDEFPGGLIADHVVAAARQLLENRQGECAVVQQGGNRILLEPVDDSRFDIAVFGAGHVGAAVVQMFAGINCNIRWIDSRRNIFPPQVADNVVPIESSQPGREVAAMPAGSYYLVLTHSHPLDYDICGRILQRGDFAYCGLIGSRSKRRRFEKLMVQQDLPAVTLQRLTCPIGVAGIEGKKPQEIAIAVAAELLKMRDAKAYRVTSSSKMQLINAGRDA
jgi:xanthine dehydrogenase accessory factor